MTSDKQSALDRLLARGHRHRVPARETLISADSHGEQLGYLLTGSLSVMVESGDGQEMVVDYLYPGDFFGESGVFDSARAGVSVVAKEASDVVLISAARFRAHCLEDPESLFEVTAQLSRRLRKASRKAARSTFLDVTSRIAYALLDLARQPDARRGLSGMEVRISKQELARLVGCSREMASRAVKELETRGLIAVSGRNIVLLSRFSHARDADDTAFGADDSLVVFPINGDEETPQ
ncbi:MAG: cyclic nucleotide-binding domain-containing protein [Gammaproteobacteria bacterium]